MESKDRYKEFYKSYEWRKARYDALKKNNGKCELCGRGKHDGIVLNVDHIIALRRGWKKRADPENLQVLCGECNHGKGNRDSTDWRGPVSAERNAPKAKRRKRKKKKKPATLKGRWEPGTFGPASSVRQVSEEEYGNGRL